VLKDSDGDGDDSTDYHDKADEDNSADYE